MNTRMRKSIVWTPLAVMLLFGLVACETTPVQQGAVVGGALGAGAGAIIGNQSHGRSGEGALIGAATGALAGALLAIRFKRNVKTVIARSIRNRPNRFPLPPRRLNEATMRIGL